MKKRSVTTFACAAVLIALAFAGSRPTAAPADAVTFSEHVAPIIFRNCTSCHRPGESAPFSLMSFEDARPRARQIAAATTSRHMPPWKPSADFSFQGDRRLTDAEIDTIRQWAAAGALQGDPAKLPPVPAFVDGWKLGPPDLVVKMPEAYDVPATGRDIYRNFVLPLNLADDVWVKAVDFRPSARAVVHHSLFFVDTTGAARRRDEADPLPGYAGGMAGAAALGAGRGLLGAFGGRGRQGGRGGPSVDRDSNQSAGGGLGGWVPGAQPMPLPDDLAIFVPKGADLVLSTHFHPSGTVEHEASTVGLYFAKTAPTKRFQSIQLPPVFGLLSGIKIPAGESSYTISDSWVLPIDVKLFGIGGHAHYLARTMKLTATLPSGERKTLLAIDDWDFGWQEQYEFADYVPLPKDTRLDATITYDNSPANRRNPSDPPKSVTWGEQSTDEMGSIIVRLVAARPNELPQLTRAFGDHMRKMAIARGPELLMLLGNIMRGSQPER